MRAKAGRIFGPVPRNLAILFLILLAAASRASAAQSAPTLKAALTPIPFDSVFYESQVDVPVALAPGFVDAPRYPRALERSGMRGSVSLTFVVDTTGHVEMGSVKTLQSSDGAFFKAVMDVLPHMAFTPAQLGGRKVRQLVKQRFDFTSPISR